MALLANIRFANIARIAKRLQVLNHSFTPIAPRHDVINV